NLHRQSLLYRLIKIESQTHLSHDNHDDVFVLSNSIKVWMTGAIPTKQMMEKSYSTLCRERWRVHFTFAIRGTVQLRIVHVDFRFLYLTTKKASQRQINIH